MECPHQHYFLCIAKSLTFVDCLHRLLYAHNGQITSGFASLHFLWTAHIGDSMSGMDFTHCFYVVHNGQPTFDVVLQNNLWLAHKGQQKSNVASQHLTSCVGHWHTTSAKHASTHMKCVYLESDVGKWEALWKSYRTTNATLAKDSTYQQCSVHIK